MLAYGGLYVSGNSTTFAASTTAAKYTTGWAAYGLSGGNKGVIEDVANSKLTVRPGVYRVTFTASVDAAAAANLTFTVRKNGTAVSGLSAIANVASAGAPVTVAVTGLVKIATSEAGDLTVYVQAATGTPNITVKEAQFVAEKLA